LPGIGFRLRSDGKALEMNLGIGRHLPKAGRCLARLLTGRCAAPVTVGRVSPPRRLREQSDLASFCGLALSARFAGPESELPAERKRAYYIRGQHRGFRSAITISAGQELRSCPARRFLLTTPFRAMDLVPGKCRPISGPARKWSPISGLTMPDVHNRL
jgi:hypothetical protein